MKRLSFLFFLTLCLTFIGSAYRTGIQNEKYSKSLLNKSNLSIFSLLSNHNTNDNSDCDELTSTFKKGDGSIFQKISFETAEENIQAFKSKLKYTFWVVPVLVQNLIEYFSQLVGIQSKSNEQNRIICAIQSIVLSIRALRI